MHIASVTSCTMMYNFPKARKRALVFSHSICAIWYYRSCQC